MHILRNLYVVLCAQAGLRHILSQASREKLSLKVRAGSHVKPCPSDSVNTTFCNLLKRLFSQTWERIKTAHWRIFVIFFLSNTHTSQQKFSLVNLMDFFFFPFWNFLFITVCHYCSLTLDLRCFISHFSTGTIFRKLK